MKPMTHQAVSIKFMADKPRVFDASDPGTGKTFVEIKDFAARRKKKGGCALILATKSLLNSAWRNDFEKFEPSLRVAVAYAENREKAFALDADAYVTNHDAAKWLASQKPAFFKKFDTLIVDESTAFKHHTSKRSNALGKIVKYFKYRRLLSGTPNSNGVTDLWHQYYLLDDGTRLGKSFFGFRASTCTPVQVGPSASHVQWTDKPGIEGVIGQLVRDITIRHKFEDCVDIPENHKYSVAYELNSKHRKVYAELEAFSITQLKDSSVTAVNGAVLYAKLMQCASGGIYNDDGKYTVIDTSRYQLVMDLVEEREHSIVFFNWEHQRDELVKEAEKRGLSFAVYDGTVASSTKRSSIVDNFQQGEYRVLFAHPQSAGHGLTLTKGVATIWASPTHNLEHYLQGLKRVHRIGQTQKTETIVVVAAGTVDERVWQSLQDKNTKLTDLLEDLKCTPTQLEGAPSTTKSSRSK